MQAGGGRVFSCLACRDSAAGEEFVSAGILGPDPLKTKKARHEAGLCSLVLRRRRDRLDGQSYSDAAISSASPS